MTEYRPLVLMVEDNTEVLRMNKKWLNEAGFDTVSAVTLAEARKLLETRSPDVTLLDILLPDGNGLDFISEYKAICDAPVLFCSSRNEDRDILLGLESGGDDYIPKPYNIDILVARIKVMWRKEKETRDRMRAIIAGKTLDRVINRGPLRLDILAGRAIMHGRDAGLTPKEFALLLMLVQNEGREVSAVELYEKVWNLPACEDTRTIKNHISRLRGKLSINDDAHTLISTEYGNGYRFQYTE